jgi:hypothetical protein
MSSSGHSTLESRLFYLLNIYFSTANAEFRLRRLATRIAFIFKYVYGINYNAEAVIVHYNAPNFINETMPLRSPL